MLYCIDIDIEGPANLISEKVETRKNVAVMTKQNFFETLMKTVEISLKHSRNTHEASRNSM